MDNFVFTTEINAKTAFVHYEVEGDCDGPVFHIKEVLDIWDQPIEYDAEYEDLKFFASEHYHDLQWQLYMKKGILI